MSETIELMLRHGSVRHYKKDTVPKEMVEQIVAAAQQSSTSSNLQMYSVVAVTDIPKKDRLAALCAGQQFIREAPVFLVWCADLSRLQRLCARQGYDHVSNYAENFILAAVDTTIFMQTAALAAESLGLGICFVGAIRNHPREIIDLLDLPRLTFPLSGMALGWPTAPPRIRPRLPLNAVLHWEVYDTSDEEAYFQAYDQAMIATGIYEGRQVEKTGELETAKNYGWAEHSARRASKAVRVGLADVLRDQGFLLD